MRERHPRVAAHFAETHGLVLSQQVMLLAAFFAGLDDSERAAVGRLGIAPWGVTEWFGDDGLTRRVRPGLDARLHARYACDPPELVTVMSGHADGLHYGFFHDEPAKPPWLLVHNFARDTGETAGVNGVGRTVIDFLHFHVQQARKDGLEVEVLLPALEELCDASAAVVAAEQPRRPKTISRLRALCGVGPALPASIKPSSSWPALEVRRRAYAASDPIVERWIAEAREAVAAGAPALALMIGHDLFFLRSAFQDEAVELLEQGYGAIGREPLARIARLHSAHRTLASVDVYEPRGGSLT